MFEPVDNRQKFPKLEEDIASFWKEHGIFRKSVEERPEDKLYVFYEGPPTANARPGVHHVLARAFKDLFPRYKTMRGYRVPRMAGWDTHGLPVELEVERELGLKSKTEIEEFGIEEFNKRCRESVFRYVQEWSALTERIAFWVDLENAYITYDNEYIESVWWIVKQLFENGLLYLDHRSTPHCPRCGTSLSDAEVALGYEEDTPDPSVYPKFRLTAGAEKRLREGPLVKAPKGAPIYIVAWTTTPWTLPANTALAVQPDAEYAATLVDGELLLIADQLVESAVQADHEKVATLKGEKLVGLKYEPLFDTAAWGVQTMWFDPEQDARLVPVDDVRSQDRAHTVLSAEFVSMDDGTGVVHIAPAFGGEDFQMGKDLGLLFVQSVDLKGEMPEGSPWPGQFVKEADPGIIDDLAGRGLMLRTDIVKHTYPFCWRCKTPLLYYAKPTWYIRTTAVKDSLIEGNQRINWYPEHIKNGRFGDWLRNNIDWGLSRERYWGTPLPVWECGSCNKHTAVGSRADLRERAVDQAAVDALDDLHRPYIDRIELKCDCGGTMNRRAEVMDAWMDSGAMPYAQWHYPRKHKEEFEKSFPADYICEAVDQTRGWFYTLHAEAVLLNHLGAVPENLAYRNVICLGHIQDDKGRKMSKSQGNVVEPMTVIDEHGADALRWYLYTATRPGDARRFSGKLVAESLRRFLLTLWNTYSFFVTYANLDGFDPATAAAGEQSDLDRWVLSELNSLVQKVTDRLEEYDPTSSGRAIQQFVDDLSNWYVRRSRRRFWKQGEDADKLAAYHTLYTCLVTVAKLMAPYTPFISEAMYQNLVRSADREAPESVHLAEWPRADTSAIDERLMNETRLVMRVVSLGRAARSKAGLKVRQPLARATAFVRSSAEAESLSRLDEQVKDELNVREVVALATSDLFTDTWTRPDDLIQHLSPTSKLAHDADSGYAVAVESAVTPELADVGLAREIVHRLQNMRKAAGFEISDHIETWFSGWDRLAQVMSEYADYVREETLSNDLSEGTAPEDAYTEEQEIEGEKVFLGVRKVS